MVCETLLLQGRYGRSTQVLILVLMEYGLRGREDLLRLSLGICVLILVLMEYGLRELHMLHVKVSFGGVLILVLMEYGLRAFVWKYAQR